MLDQPYLGSSFLICDATKPATTEKTPAGALIASIEVQPGKAVYYEVNPPGRVVSVDEGSPMISGKTQCQIGKGWTISVIEAEI